MSNWKIILWIVLFFPLGIYYTWKYSSWRKEIKYGITGFFGLVSFLLIFNQKIGFILAFCGLGLLYYAIATFKSSSKKQKWTYFAPAVVLIILGISLPANSSTESVKESSTEPKIATQKKETVQETKAVRDTSNEDRVAAEKKAESEKAQQAAKEKVALAQKEATDAIVLAESAPTRENYDKANTLVVALTNEDQGLSSRLGVIKATVETQEAAAKKAEENRLAAAAKAESDRVAAEEAARIAEEQRVAAAAQAQEEAAAATAVVDTNQQQVLVTPTGTKYHNHKCGNGTYTPATLQEALNRGLEPCSKCF